MQKVLWHLNQFYNLSGHVDTFDDFTSHLYFIKKKIDNSVCIVKYLIRREEVMVDSL